MRFLSVALFLVAVLAIAPKLIADDQENEKGLVARFQDLNLTDEQDAKIAEIRKECRPKVEEAVKELASVVKEELGKIEEVLTPEQKTKLQALKEERKEHRFEGLAARIAHLKDLHLTDAEMTKIEGIRNEFHPKIVKAMAGFKGILNSDQTSAREEGLKAGKKHREIIASLNLTGEQKEKCESACKEVATFVREEMEKIRDVLDAGQREKFAELKDERMDRVRDRWAHRIANFSDLNLSEEQKAKIAQIRTEFGPKVHEAGNKARAAIREEIEMIVNVMKG
jgi:Spy/CpxP family protein refolding chaperone